MATYKEDCSEIVLPNEAVEKISELLKSTPLQLAPSSGHHHPPREHVAPHTTTDQILSAPGYCSSNGLTTVPGEKVPHRKKRTSQGRSARSDAEVPVHFGGLAPLPSASFEGSCGAPAVAPGAFELSSMTHALPLGVGSLESDLSGSTSFASGPGPYFNYREDLEPTSSLRGDLSAGLPSGLSPYVQYQDHFSTSSLESNTSDPLSFSAAPSLYAQYGLQDPRSSMEGNLPVSLVSGPSHYLQYRDQDPNSSLDSNLSGSFPLPSGHSLLALQEPTSSPEEHLPESVSLASGLIPYQCEDQASTSSLAVTTTQGAVLPTPQQQRKPKTNLKNLTVTEKQQHKKELNNKSSKVYRDRTRAKTGNIEDWRRHLEDENGKLRDRVQELEKELQMWRSMGEFWRRNQDSSCRNSSPSHPH